MTLRENSIDVLRGVAILGMVLSGTISRNAELPAWLFHAQIAPPDFIFNPNLPGITWVDLVFPFFLFAMGMAFPFSFNRSLEKGSTRGSLIRKIVLRALKLWFFAIILGHLSPFHYPQEMGLLRYALGLSAFVGLFMAFSKFPHWKKHENLINIAGYVLLIFLLFARVRFFNQSFSVHQNDIIILVLANMALFGSLIWLLSRTNWYLRLGILAIYFALRMTHSIDDSWNKLLWDFTPLKWLAATFPALQQSLSEYGIELTRTIFYHPDYLKYLMIIIPGSIMGDIAYEHLREPASYRKNEQSPAFILMPLILFTNIAFNLWGLLSRNLEFVWLMNLATAAGLIFMVNKTRFKALKGVRNLILWSTFWLILGLVFEAYQGGIKKDHATLSYFFLTSGLAGYSIVLFKTLSPWLAPDKPLGFSAITGMNPMLGYVAAAYFIMPVLMFLQIQDWMDQWHTTWPWLGFIRGIVLTSLMVLLCYISVKKKYFWKT